MGPSWCASRDRASTTAHDAEMVALVAMLQEAGPVQEHTDEARTTILQLTERGALLDAVLNATAADT